MREAWKYYESKILPASLAPSDRELAEQSFFVGALSLMSVLRTVLEERHSPEHLSTVLSLLQDEIHRQLPDEAFKKP